LRNKLPPLISPLPDELNIAIPSPPSRDEHIAFVAIRKYFNNATLAGNKILSTLKHLKMP
jgi:hypothetical protein